MILNVYFLVIFAYYCQRLYMNYSVLEAIYSRASILKIESN